VAWIHGVLRSLVITPRKVPWVDSGDGPEAGCPPLPRKDATEIGQAGLLVKSISLG
jgi:hypothetical protein